MRRRSGREEGVEGKAVSDVEALRLALMMVMGRGTFGSV